MSLREENALVLMEVEGVAVQCEVGVCAVLAVGRDGQGDADGVVDGAELGAGDGDTPALVQFDAEYPPERSIVL